MLTTLQRVRQSDRALAIDSRYLGNNPTNATDPTGLLAEDDSPVREKGEDAKALSKADADALPGRTFDYLKGKGSLEVYPYVIWKAKGKEYQGIQLQFTVTDPAADLTKADVHWLQVIYKDKVNKKLMPIANAGTYGTPAGATGKDIWTLADLCEQKVTIYWALGG